ncbi:MAG: calcium-binding EGF-like domain-containing protein [Saprospiraceae bacterium]
MKYLILFLSIVLFSTSCSKKDPCEGVICQNNGICETGTCNCPTGYEGTFCELESAPKKVKVSSIKVLKIPQTKPDGTNWDTDGTNPDIFPVVYTMKTDGKTVDQVYWVSNLINTNAKISGQPAFSIILPALEFTDVNKLFAIFLFDKDGNTEESMGPGIIFNLKNDIKGRPSTITIDCTNCLLAFELDLKYEF